MKKMTCTEVRKIDLVDYLISIGHYPKKTRNQDYWYLSPMRKERTTSFKVNRTKNVWFDFGSGKGGNIIDFGVLFHNCSVGDFLARLSDSNTKQLLSFHTLSSSVPPITNAVGEKEGNTKCKIVVTAVRPLSSPQLLNYLVARSIHSEIAARFCKEVDFILYDKKQTAIGFQNDSGGFELRSQYFKGSSSPKDISFIDNDSGEVAVFEGFFNFLSFQIINKDLGATVTNCLVLNSLSFFQRNRLLMEKHKTVHLFLDRDNAGKRCTDQALEWNKSTYVDNSDFHKDHKDLNDWLIEHSLKFKLANRIIHKSNNEQIKTNHNGRI